MIAAIALLTFSALPENADGVRAQVAEALLDADSRSSLLLQSATAGHDGHFFLADDSGDFRLNISGQIQTRFLASWRDDDGGIDSFSSGFQMRRVKVAFDGRLFDESLRFKITNEFGRSGGSARISDAYLEKQFGDGVSIKAGQFKLPFTREDLDSSKRQLAVERSLVNSVFKLSRSQGVQIHFQGDDWRAWAAYSDGARSANTDFGADPTDWALTMRGEWLAVGSFDSFRSQAGAIDAIPSLRFGGAVHAEERGASPGDVGGRMIAWTADLTGAGPGWTAMATLVGRESAEPTGEAFTDWGATAQFGVWATESVVPFVRWELLIPDDDRAGDSKTNVLTAGANWFLHGEALKFTLDGVWLIDGAGSNDLIGSGTGAGVLPPGAGDNEFVLRAQVQVLF